MLSIRQHHCRVIIIVSKTPRSRLWNVVWSQTVPNA